MRKASRGIGVFICVWVLLGFVGSALAQRQVVRAPTDEVEEFALTLMSHVAKRYFDPALKPVIKVAVFDFVDEDGNITVGSDYLSNRIRLAFGQGPQFQLLPVHQITDTVTQELFKKKGQVRKRVVNELKADVYLVGKVELPDRSQVICNVRLWGVKTGADYSTLDTLLPAGCRLIWRPNLSESGFTYFRRVMTEKMARAGAAAARPTTFGDLILLTQPINDDLNPYWRLKNGMVLPREREETRLSSGSQYGRVMQSRRKAYDRAMGLDYVIRNFSLMIKERGKKTIELASYILPKMSDYYYIADRKEGSGYRFKYLWYYRNRGTRRVAGGVGKGWNFRMADRDWSLKLLTGYHTGIATFAPVSQSLYGSVTTRPEYVSKFKILIKPGLNVYVVNYVYHRDEPYIFVRRLDLKEGSPVSDKKSKLTLVETHTVYGSD